MGQRIALATSGDSPDHQRHSMAGYTTPNRLDKTTVQVRNLLEIIASLKDFTAPEPSPLNSPSPHPEVVAASVKTTEMALSQLDNIIEDMSRWNLSTDPLETVHERLVEAQIRNLEQSRKPSTRYMPAIARLSSGRWAAIMAQSGEVIATGDTPGDALKAFDEAFDAVLLSAQGKLARGAPFPEEQPPAEQKPVRRRRKKDES